MTSTNQLAMRRLLRREIVGTIGLLADQQDFAAMRCYSTFPFDDHESYLREMESLLRTRAATGGYTAVALFEPQEFTEFCTDLGLEPDAQASRTRYTAELATTGPALPYEGQALSELIPVLIDEAVHKATWEFATAALAGMGPCAVCGEDIGRAAYARATSLLARILDTAGPGHHYLACSVLARPETLAAGLHADVKPEGKPRVDESEVLEFVTVLALSIATHSAGGIVIRTSAPSATDRVYGWRMTGDRLQPLTAGEVFDAYRSDIRSGDVLSLESDVDYCEPPDLGDAGQPGGHRH
ncbi:hypothetical protein ABZ896_41285 [Streptomyces sp. NPDC047072]|uniref:hypothetical protein n=1 Tax=Streptomyces sp. NPDC047072 TaxID=3154809 RepID=UPI0033C44A6B